MSGRYAFTTGMQHSYWITGQDGGLPLKFKTMANHLKDLGYSTHMVGKWCVRPCLQQPRHTKITFPIAIPRPSATKWGADSPPVFYFTFPLEGPL